MREPEARLSKERLISRSTEVGRYARVQLGLSILPMPIGHSPKWSRRHFQQIIREFGFSPVHLKEMVSTIEIKLVRTQHVRRRRPTEEKIHVTIRFGGSIDSIILYEG